MNLKVGLQNSKRPGNRVRRAWVCLGTLVPPLLHLLTLRVLDIVDSLVLAGTVEDFCGSLGNVLSPFLNGYRFPTLSFQNTTSTNSRQSMSQTEKLSTVMVYATRQGRLRAQLAPSCLPHYLGGGTVHAILTAGHVIPFMAKEMYVAGRRQVAVQVSNTSKRRISEKINALSAPWASEVAFLVNPEDDLDAFNLTIPNLNCHGFNLASLPPRSPLQCQGSIQ